MDSKNSKKEKIKNKVYLVDDDEDFNRIVQIILKKMNVDIEVFSQEKEFLKKIAIEVPQLCLIDLNFSDQKNGFLLIEILRKKIKNTIPLIVVSAESDPEMILKALSLGANDYFVKPIDKEVLYTKLSRYIFTQELIEQSSLFFVQEGGFPAVAELAFDVISLMENGITVASEHLIQKDAIVHLGGPLVFEIAQEKIILTKVQKTWFDSNQRKYFLFLEFDHFDFRLQQNVRTWMSHKVKITI